MTAPVLRSYQQSAIRDVFASMRRGNARVVLVMPTGSGKTAAGADVVRRAVAADRKVVWLAHRTELVEQSAATLHALGLDVGVLSASSVWPAKPDAPVQVASIQTLVARETIRPPANLIVADECHHLGTGASTWLALLDAYPMTHILGLTATPERSDGTGLAPLFTDLVVGVTVRQLVAMGHLVPCEIVRPDSWLKAKRASGNPLAQPPLDAYREHAAGRQGFLFAASVEEAEGYARAFTEAGIRAECIHADTPSEDRAITLRLFRDGVVRILTNVYVMTEGVDIPQASVCILARGAGTAGTMLQMVGRVLRPYPGKRTAMLIDLQGVSHVWGPPEDERIYKLEGKAIVRAGEHCAVCKVPLVEYPCGNCGYMPEPDEDGGATGTEITGDRLSAFARKIAAGPEQRKETLLRWMTEAAYKDRAPGSVRFRFRNAYDVDIGASEYFRALGDLTHDLNPIVSDWSKKHLARINEKRRARG